MLNPKLQKLDRRHNGFTRFNYRVEFYEIPQFNQIRDWCWETWGSSCELDHASRVNFVPPKDLVWCWRCDENPRGMYLYFKSYNEASVYSLKWS